MGDKHANKGASLRKQSHAKQDLQQARVKAAKKLTLESAAEMQPIQTKTNGRSKG